jgi:hypothetical protein
VATHLPDSEPSVHGPSRGLHRHARAVDLTLVALLILGAAAVRFPELSGTGLVPEREFRSAFIARDLAFADDGAVPPWRRHVVETARLQEERLEPPIMEHLTAATWRLLGSDELWIAHAWASLFWLSGGVLLFALLRSSLHIAGAAWPALVYYLYAPAGLRISTAFQPDSLMVASMIGGLLAIVRHHLRPAPYRLVLAAVSSGAAMLVKPTSLFLLSGAFLASVFTRMGWKKGLLSREPLVFGLAAAPAAVYYAWTTLGDGGLAIQVQMTFQTHLYRVPTYWTQWARLAVQETAAPFLALALLAPVLAGRWRPLLLGIWLGYLVYGLTFPYHIHTHGYYQLPLLVLAAWSTGIVCSQLASRAALSTRATRALWPTASLLALALVGTQYRWSPERHAPTFESTELARRIGEITGHSTRVVFVSPHRGLPLQYVGEMSGRHWPRPPRRLYGTAEIVGHDTVQDRLARLGFVPEYFVITDFASWERHHADLKAFLEARCAQLEEGLSALIWSNCNLSGSSENVAEVRVPATASWIDRGEIFGEGPDGSWDRILWGGFAATAVKRDDTFLLYYQGSSAYDERFETVTHRAVGLATSTDGLRFQKHPLNPVLRWSPTGGLEEGAASAAALREPGGTIALYYGANTATSRRLVSADGRCSTSEDGMTFADCTDIVLDHRDRDLWGSGDELFPVIALHDGSRRIVYYLPNGRLTRRQLGVAWGTGRTDLDSSAVVTSGGRPVHAWGPAGSARLAPERYALFLSAEADRHSEREHLDVYLMSAATPMLVTGPVETYSFENMSRGTVLLDRETETWFLFYRNRDSTAYGVRTAPLELAQ